MNDRYMIKKISMCIIWLENYAPDLSKFLMKGDLKSIELHFNKECIYPELQDIVNDYSLQLSVFFGTFRYYQIFNS